MIKGTVFSARLPYLQRLLLAGVVSMALSGCASGPREALPPSVPVSPVGGIAPSPLDCTTAQDVQKLVCEDAELAALDLQLNEVFEAAVNQASEAQRSTLKAIQYGWAKDRDKCGEQDDKRRCVAEAYHQRTAELQATYRLVEQRGPVHFVCGDRPANEITVTWFETTPKTLIAERGDSISLMYQAEDASSYHGRNESLSERQDTITIVWGHGAPQITCQAAPKILVDFRSHVISANKGTFAFLRVKDVAFQSYEG